MRLPLALLPHSLNNIPGANFSKHTQLRPSRESSRGERPKILKKRGIRIVKVKISRVGKYSGSGFLCFTTLGSGFMGVSGMHITASS